jgi:6-pyruvoyltetrahydropterin/6-carboxytetrahydropterin synthase
MNTSPFCVRIASDDLTFCAAHFITFEDGRCERLHGHTYHATAEVSGLLNDSRYVVDFLVVRDALKRILAELDHRMLLPAQHPHIRVESRDGRFEGTFADRRWLFPQDDCLLVPIANTTTELLAEYIGEKLAAAIKQSSGDSPLRLRIEIGEGSGFAAICDLSR